VSLTLDDLGPIVQPTIQLDAQQKLVSCSIQSSSETSIIWLQPQCQMWLIVCCPVHVLPEKWAILWDIL